MADYLNTAQYWGNSYWGGSYWGILAGVSFDYAEIWDGTVVMNLAVTGSVQMSRTVATGVVMNRTITDSYSELEGI